MNLKDPKIQKIMLGAMAVVILSFIYFGTSFLPFNYPVRRAKIQALEAEHEKLSAELEKARRIVGNLARLEAEYERLHEQCLSAQELLPEEQEMPDLLRKVTTAGVRAGVEFALFQPQAPAPRDFYSEHPVKVQIRGGYHQVGIFFSRLANMPRIVNVSRLQLTSPRSGKRAGKRHTKAISTVSAEFSLSAYTLSGGVANESIEAETASVE